ncbi:MAG: TraR/DksA family transcriptional regulator [Gemmatimonadota bacterium]
MRKEQLKALEERLLEERGQVLKELGWFDDTYTQTMQGASGDLSAYSFHMADQGTDAMEREKAFLFASKEGRQLLSIDAALRRLYGSDRAFGQCEGCGQEINWERLEAVPHTRFCLACKAAEENGRARR